MENREVGASQTMVEKIWDQHQVDDDLLYVDLHLVHEVTSPQAFEGLRMADRNVRRPDKTIATVDHNVPTESPRSLATIQNHLSKEQIELLEKNCEEFGIPFFGLGSDRQGIVHVIGPEQGLTQPGMTIVCGDSHTSTHGAFGAIALGIGTSEVEHVLATQCLAAKKPETMRINYKGELPERVTAKDIILATIGKVGTSGLKGAVEYAGKPIQKFSMEERMTVCNMSIEGGARIGLIAPDDTTFEYLRARKAAPRDFEGAIEYWRSLPSDADAKFDCEIDFDVSDLAPMVTWGTNPGMVSQVTEAVPDPSELPSRDDKESAERALAYMDLKPGTPLLDIPLDKVFIGSCTNSRISDLRRASAMVKGRKVADSVQAMVVPGSQHVKAAAEREGLDEIFKQAGFEWRESGCSMCLAMNSDELKAGERCASTSNRNFEGRQGKGGRTHLVSPEMAAAAAITGRFVDIREWG